MSQPMQVPQLLVMPIANQNMYYYPQNPSKLVNQLIMYHNQKDMGNNIAPQVPQNISSKTNATNSQPIIGHHGDIQSQQINYLLMQQPQPGKVGLDKDMAVKNESSVVPQPQCTNILQMVPSPIPVALLQRGMNQIMPNSSMQLQFDNKFLPSTASPIHPYMNPNNMNYKIIGNIQNPAQRLFQDLSMNQLLVQSLNGKNTLLSPHQQQNPSESYESQSYTQTDQQDNGENVQEEDLESDQLGDCIQNVVSQNKNTQSKIECNDRIQNKSSVNNINTNNSREFQIQLQNNSKEIIVKQELGASAGDSYNQVESKLITKKSQIQSQEKRSSQTATISPAKKQLKNNKKRSHKQLQQEARISVGSATTAANSIYEKITNTKLEDADLFMNQPSTQSNSVIKNDYGVTNYQGFTSNQQNSHCDSAQNQFNMTSGDNHGEYNCKYSNKEFCETSSSQSQDDEEDEVVQDSPLVKKYCKFSSISSSDNTNGSRRKSEIIIICSLKPKEKIKKSKQDYYNDSNYTKNLLKGFRRYMKRYLPDQQVFQQFERFFDTHQLNNELILKLFAHNEYSSSFNKFLSQPPLWWIQEAKIKDVEKQIGFFNLCRQKKFNSIKTKRKSFQRPLI